MRTKQEILDELDTLTAKSGQAPVLPIDLVKDIVNSIDPSNNGYPLYKEVLLQAEDLVGVKTEPIAEILPELDSNHYYDIDSVTFEVTGGSVPFVLNPDRVGGFIVTNGQGGCSIGLNPSPMSMLSAGQTSVSVNKFSDIIQDSGGGGFNIGQGQREITNGPVRFRAYSTEEAVFLDGNGQLIIKLRYAIRTLGSELPVED